MKLLKKSILIAMLIIAIAIPVFANGGAEKTDSDKEKVVTLSISHNMDFITIPNAVVDAAERLNEKYAAEGKNLRIEFEKDYQTIDWTEYHNNTIFSAKSGDLADFFALDSDIPGYVKAGVLMDLTDLSKELSSYMADAFGTATIDGKVYAFPPDLPTRVMYYNTDDLRKIGWTEEQITLLPEQIKNGEFTFEDFLSLAEEVVAKGGAKYGLTHRPGQGNDFFDILKVLGCQFYNEDGTLVFDDEGLLRFFTMTYKNANETKITPNNLNQMGWTSINKLVGSGDCFAYYGPVYSCGYVAGAVEKTIEEFASYEEFVLFPVSEYNDKPFAVAAPQYIAINSKTKYPEICKDLLKELVTDSSDLLARHAAKINSLSSVTAANKDEQVLANPLVSKIGYMTDYSITYPSISGLNTYSSELFKQIVALELGETTPEKAVADMKQQIELNVNDVIFK